VKSLLEAVLNRPVLGDFFDRRARQKPNTGSKGDDLLEMARVVLPGVASALIATTDAIGRFVSLSLFYSKIVDTLFLLVLWWFCLYWLCSTASARSELFPERTVIEYRYSPSRRLASKIALVVLPLFIGANLWRLTPNAIKAHFDEDSRSLCGYVCNATTAAAITQGNIALWDEFGNRAAGIEKPDDAGLVCFEIRGSSFTLQKLKMQTPGCKAPVEHEVDDIYSEIATGCPSRAEESFPGRVWVLDCAK
jgi:hypothetical protein